MNIGKMAYHEPRPFMDDNKIKTWPSVCSTEYGNPSGHSMFAFGFNSFMFLDIYHGSLKGKVYSKVAYAFWFFFAFALASLICFARFYVMVHSLNEILYGLLLGLWLSFYFHFCLRTPLMQHIKEITENESVEVRYKKYIIWSSIVFLTQVAA